MTQLEQWLINIINRGDFIKRANARPNTDNATSVAYYAIDLEDEDAELLAATPQSVRESLSLYKDGYGGTALEPSDYIYLWKVSLPESAGYVLVTVDSAGSEDLEGVYEVFDADGKFLAANFWGQKGFADEVFGQDKAVDLSEWREFIRENGCVL